MSLSSKIKSLPIAKVFSKDKLVASPFLNKIGIQPFRLWLANKRYHDKQYLVDSSVVNQVDQLMKDGIILVENFMSDSEFAAITKECRSFIDSDSFETSKKVGSNTIYNQSIENMDKTVYPTTTGLLNHPLLLKLFSAADKRELDPTKGDIIILIQYLVQGDGEDLDIESELHVDTFFNTYKAWLYLDDVRLENGPFSYVKGSHTNLNKDRYNNVYHYSLQKDVSGSRRVSKNEVDDLGLQETTVLCKKNTLAMANTFGFHRRLQGVNGNDRLTIAITAKRSPF